MQCLLLSDGKNALHPSHVVVLPPGDGGSSTAAISFTGALRIPVSPCAWGGQAAVGKSLDCRSAQAFEREPVVVDSMDREHRVIQIALSSLRATVAVVLLFA
jgi:hypothetical protein